MSARLASHISKLMRHIFGKKHHAARWRFLPLSKNVHLQISGLDDENLMLTPVQMKRRPSTRRSDRQTDRNVISGLLPNDLEHDCVSKRGELLALFRQNDDWLHGKKFGALVGWIAKRG